MCTNFMFGVITRVDVGRGEGVGEIRILTAKTGPIRDTTLTVPVSVEWSGRT